VTPAARVAVRKEGPLSGKVTKFDHLDCRYSATARKRDTMQTIDDQWLQNSITVRLVFNDWGDEVSWTVNVVSSVLNEAVQVKHVDSFLCERVAELRYGVHVPLQSVVLRGE